MRSQVRTGGTHSGVRTGQFARQVRNRLCANLGGLPVIKSYGLPVEVSTVVSTVSQVPGEPHSAVNGHMKTTMLAAQRQPIRSQVFSGSCRWVSGCAEVMFAP